MHVSAYYGHTNVVNVLLLAGADLEAAWSSAQTLARPAIAATFDASCIDAMTSAQRTAIMKNHIGLSGCAPPPPQRISVARCVVNGRQPACRFSIQRGPGNTDHSRWGMV